ncbi:ubiquitin carboxyl-terminal hydrolase MINDY-1-like isoform X1 [Juglans microcarpa x Juglans regia]|uniref:ubiquitin carboxyl-terminal hydrolase MINDY-1-like isoform X1 n=1 Tax=Juglans microcarpa x Juglans regia TaxID=2249226 RepID=UPI001B7F3F90|nr:ubiquitin carboxyl-terminal hydrolase MINDY-1-like isoform X1 [Juglans microcarpa x Juglans regia]
MVRGSCQYVLGNGWFTLWVAAGNVLLLRNNLNLSPETVEVSQEKLLALVAERLIDSNSNLNNKDAGYVENQQQNISDAIDLLPRLATGIDVNIKFRRMDDFEFTPECAIFDLLDIPLYHGWIVDPQDTGTATAIGSKSYNALTGELVALETQNMEGLSQKGELIRNFLKNNASQLTIKGLFCLRDGLKERELCVFFRNNHFSTMFKFDGELYLLATDQGYINQPDLVWEKLNEVNGDTLFMTGNFKEFGAESRANDTLDGKYPNYEQSGSSDLQLATALQEQEFEEQPQRPNSQQSGSSDLQLATALQEQEFEEQPQRPNSQQSGSSDLQLATALQQQEFEEQPQRPNSQQSGSSDLQLATALQQLEFEQQPQRPNSQ